MLAASSESRKATTRAAAWGEIQSLRSASGMSARFAGVPMMDGSTAFFAIVGSQKGRAQLAVVKTGLCRNHASFDDRRGVFGTGVHR